MSKEIFTCPRCGSNYFGRDAVTEPMPAVTDTVRCHGYKHGDKCGWVGSLAMLQLLIQWERAEKQYRSQVAEARAAVTPWAGMLAHATQLAECRAALEKLIK